MSQETMTPRERWTTVLDGGTPDRVPTDYWATSEATDRLLNHLGLDTLEQARAELHIDPLLIVGGRYTGPRIPENEDVFGCRFEKVNYGTGTYRECIHNPLAEYDTVEEIDDNYTWPDPDWWSYDHLPEQIKGRDDLPVRGGGSEPFLIYKRLRGMEQGMMDLALNPDIVHYCLDHLFDLACESTRRIFEQIPDRVLISYVAEDLGGQEGLLISRERIKEFLLPRMKRMMDLVHQAGAYVFTHTDGAVRDVLPDLIEAGTDVLNPIQWRCPGMEREGLKRDFGDDLVFHGAVDNQYTLASGSVEEVRKEVRHNIRILGRGGGYILAPCHNIQSVSPPENIVAMYETAWREGWY
ncbi:MAG: uroporphyrinogen decarboxylase family protein [Candidatus Brocadiia bacterium]